MLLSLLHFKKMKVATISFSPTYLPIEKIHSKFEKPYTAVKCSHITEANSPSLNKWSTVSILEFILQQWHLETNYGMPHLLIAESTGNASKSSFQPNTNILVGIKEFQYITLASWKSGYVIPKFYQADLILNSPSFVCFQTLWSIPFLGTMGRLETSCTSWGPSSWLNKSTFQLQPENRSCNEREGWESGSKILARFPHKEPRTMGRTWSKIILKRSTSSQWFLSLLFVEMKTPQQINIFFYKWPYDYMKPWLWFCL